MAIKAASSKALLFALIAALWADDCAAYCDTCPRDKHGRIQRSTGAKAEFKREYPCPATYRSRGACPGYVIDHIIALKRGGEDSPGNMQWQTIAEARAKDRWE